MGFLTDINTAQTAIQARKIAKRMPQGGEPDVLAAILRELEKLNDQLAWQNRFIAQTTPGRWTP